MGERDRDDGRVVADHVEVRERGEICLAGRADGGYEADGSGGLRDGQG